MKPLIYIVDDEPLQLHYLQVALSRSNYDVQTFADPREMLAALTTKEPDAAVIDLIMPQLSGIDVIREIRRRSLHLPLVAVTAYPEIETAMNAIRAGANDYLKKPFQTQELQFVVQRLLDATHLRTNLESLLEQHASQYSLDGFIGSSSAIERTRVALRRLADMPNASVLITGPYGSGKSYAARMLHYAHPDVSKRLLEIGCAEHETQDLERQLFGWEEQRDDRTIVSHASLLDVAGSGTILLDDITDADVRIQRQLHDLLVASAEKADPRQSFRLIAMSLADPSKEETQALFHPPLLEALSLFTVWIPALRDRDDDVLELAQHFIEGAGPGSSARVRGLTDAAARALKEYSWPGNVRELRSVIERAIVSARTPMIDVEDLHLGATHAGTDDGRSASNTLTSLRELEIQQIKRVLEFTGGDVTRAAQILGISRKSLWERRKRYSLP